MLAKSCKDCGCPLFEYKGEVSCVVCAEGGAKAGKQETGKGTGKTSPSVPPAGSAGVAGEEARRAAPAGHTTLAASLEGSLIVLCGRIESEADPEKVLTLVKALQKGIEALMLLDQS